MAFVHLPPYVPEQDGPWDRHAAAHLLRRGGFGAAPADVARLSAAMFTISYSEALLVSVLSGAAWDFAGTPRFAFLPIVIAALPLLFLPALIRFRRSSDAATR